MTRRVKHRVKWVRGGPKTAEMAAAISAFAGEVKKLPPGTARGVRPKRTGYQTAMEFLAGRRIVKEEK